MQRDNIKRFYIIHSWVGVITAVLMFVVCITGAISVFGHPELKIWSSPAMHEPHAIEHEAVEQLIREYGEKVDPSYHQEISVGYPGYTRHEDLALYFQRDIDTPDGSHIHDMIRFNIDPQTLELVGQDSGEFADTFSREKTDMADFITTFHADLHLGDPVGLLVTGVLGLALLVSIVSGVFIHRKILKEMFTFRPFRSLHLLWTDAHKVMGVWGLLFHAVIGFTGAFLGLAVVLLLPAAAYVSYDGDTEKLLETFLSEPKPVITGEILPFQIAPSLNAMSELDAGKIVSFSLHGGGDKGALMVVSALAEEDITGYQHNFIATTGELLSRTTTFSQLDGATGSVLDVVFPLHFGNFGGLFIKTVWAVMGLSTGFLALSGMMIWIERRAYGPVGNLSTNAYSHMARFSVSSCIGLVVAIVALFYAQLLLQVPAAVFGYWLGVIFFGSWIISTLVGYMQRNENIAAKLLLFIAGIGFVLLPFASGMITGSHWFNLAAKHHTVVAVIDIVLLVSGLLSLFLAYKIPIDRQLSKSNVVPDLTIRPLEVS
jgi:uncharacterized iron-regulated membrane protein